jgi:hypothetical protein
MKTANYCMVGLAFMEKFWQEWAVHLPRVFVKKSCVPECVKTAKEGKT